LQRGRIPVVLEASSLIRNEIEDEIPMVAGIEGPFDLASSLCGSSSFLMWTINNPDTVKVVIEKCIDACIICAKAYLRSGANAVVMADALSSPEMMDPDAFRQFVKPALIRFTKSIEGYSILHICGKVDSIIPDMLECGFDAISIEENVKDLEYVIDLAHRNDTAVIGNIYTSNTLYRKTPEDVRKEAFKSCTQTYLS